MSSETQRDVFFSKLYQKAKANRDLIVVSADMSAPALDEFRVSLPSQFVNVGIAEQNAIVIGAGLACEGKKVFVYAIAPFITLRCLEQIRVSNCINKIPMTIVGMGTGLSYCNDGPTHHLIEDLAVMRAMPGINTLNTTDNVMAGALVDMVYDSKATNYIRLDKDLYENVYADGFDFSRGLAKVKSGKKFVIVTTGPMVHVARELVAQPKLRDLDIGIIDVFRLPVNPGLMEMISGAKKIITLEEGFLAGGLGSAVCEMLADANVSLPVKRLGLDSEHGYAMCYKYGGREVVRSHFGLGRDDIKKSISSFFN